MSKECREFDFEERLIDFAARITGIQELLRSYVIFL